MFMTFGEYQERAHSFSRICELGNPVEEAGRWAMSEMNEVWFEPGDARKTGLLQGWIEYNPEVALQIAKEFGDVLWFIGEDASNNQRSLDILAKDSLRRNGKILTTMSDVPIKRFDIEANKKAGDYSVVNYELKPFLKPGEMHHAHTTISESPAYVLSRVFARLGRALSPSYRVFSNGPASSTDFESDRLIDRSRADSLWVMSWIGQTMLGTSLEEIAEINLEKLTRREEAGTVLSGQDVDRSR